MLSWIATQIFYAVVFFFLGAWTASMSPGFRTWMHHASHVGELSFDKMRDWTADSLLKTPDFSKSYSTQSTADVTPAPGSDEANPTQAAAPETAPAPAAPAAQSADATQAPAPTAPQASTAPASEAAVAGDALARAREAFARKDIDAAIGAYRAYIKQNPGAIGARGELGNVYYAAGRKQDAAQMFFECATKNLDAGNVSGAKALVGAVREGNPAMADDLERRIATASNKKS